MPVVDIGGFMTSCEFQVAPSFTVAWAGRQTRQNAIGGEVTELDLLT